MMILEEPKIDNLLAQKKMAAQKVLPFIKNNMVLGLGTGSTVNIFLDFLAEYIAQEGLNISSITTSVKTRKRAEALSLDLIAQNKVKKIDLCIDGADEFDDQLNLIKGGGGALLCEKIVASAAEKMIVIADETKYAPILGDYHLPIEIVPFETGIIFAQLQNIHAKYAISGDFKWNLRKNSDGAVFKTDTHHVITDISFGGISNLKKLSSELLAVPGIVDHGLFLNNANVIITEKRILSGN